MSAVITEQEVWRAALVMVRRYKTEAIVEAATRADQLLEDGDWHAAITWRRILDAIKRIQAEKLPEKHTVH